MIWLHGAGAQPQPAASNPPGERRFLGQGREEGLRRAVEMLCGAFGIPFTDDKRRETANMDATHLAALLMRLNEQKRWI